MWTYQITTGVLSTPEGSPLAPPGYAGNGLGKNNPAAQDQHDVGPLPCGMYTVGPAYDSPKTGPMSMNLTPDAANQMYGRGGFRCHGDSIRDPGNASDGCIVQAQVNRLLLNASTDKRLQVIP
jgi:hypothetical protein